MSLIHTTHGAIDESLLRYDAAITNCPDEVVAFARWLMPAHEGCAICADPNNPQPFQGEVEVRKDVWVSKKNLTVEATALAAALT